MQIQKNDLITNGKGTIHYRVLRVPSDGLPHVQCTQTGRRRVITRPEHFRIVEATTPSPNTANTHPPRRTTRKEPTQ